MLSTYMYMHAQQTFIFLLQNMFSQSIDINFENQKDNMYIRSLKYGYQLLHDIN